MPRAYIIAGPNGAGKTTFAREFLPRLDSWMLFDNSDLPPQTIACEKRGRLKIDLLGTYERVIAQIERKLR